MIPIILAERMPLFRRGIRSTLERTGEWVVFEATEHVEIMELAQSYHPECVILAGDLATSFDTCWELRRQIPTVGILVIDPSPDEERFLEFLVRGASAYELRSISPEVLVDRVCRVCRGEYLNRSDVLSQQPRAALPSAASLQSESPANGSQASSTTPSPLSRREIQMLEHIAQGNSNKEIAKSLNISDQTVKNHITSILKKLSVDDRTAAVVHALRHGWIVLELPGTTRRSARQ